MIAKQKRNIKKLLSQFRKNCSVLKIGSVNDRQEASGFTLIELMIIVGIIAIMVSIILTMAIAGARDKAAVVSYKTSMQSLRTSIELCLVGGDSPSIVAGDNEEGNPICFTDDVPPVAANESKFPAMRNKCNDYSSLRYQVTKMSDPAVKWKLTTVKANAPHDDWDCRGCQAVCDTNDCVFTPKLAGDCY